ncbi:four helix bundle protein [Mucilaginibacter limnophilus]|uniref:Four helix bundle protein n=1 Tax=Mucilaginibacter limnophilus TaxID=1932778 RepID=A0A437MW76_9SPHI|nr:four helix bundle protein [Mucilaginibacter limnophilus]RVU01910.1 four helix bundle protein [Mucilaginibacter limnophilus]
MPRHNFKNLKIWQKAMDLVDLVYLYTDDLPIDERYNLISQTNKSACSVPSNIAEGSGKRTNVHFSEFLTTSLTSSFELETQLLICQRRKYGSVQKLNECIELLKEVQKMIFSFREYILSNDNPDSE